VRIGYIGHFGDWHTEWGVAKALEEKAQVDRYHFPVLDQKAFTERAYDLVLTTVPHMLPLDFWVAQSGYKVAHYFDLIVGWKGREQNYFPALRHFDLVLGTDCLHPAYRAEGINAHWFLQAYDPEDYYPVGAELERDVAFIGSPYDSKRQGLMPELRKRYTFERLGQGNTCRGEAHARVCASSKIMVADNAVNDRPGYWSNRVYMHLACKGFVLHPRVPEMERFFEGGKHLVYYDSREDLLDKIDHYLERDEEREAIAQAGAELVRAEHTWTVRMKRFWQIFESGSSPTRI